MLQYLGDGKSSFYNSNGEEIIFSDEDLIKLRVELSEAEQDKTGHFYDLKQISKEQNPVVFRKRNKKSSIRRY